MPLKDLQKRKEFMKKYYEKNKEKIAEQKKKYNEKNKEKIKERVKKYREENKELIKERLKKYYQDNKEKINEIKKKYRQTPQGKKITIIANWKCHGIIADDYDEWYEKYVNCNECNFCHKEFTSTKDRCLDHNHDINHCENIRGILCTSCNVKDVFLDLLI